MLNEIIKDFPKLESLTLGLDPSLIRDFEIYYHESYFGLKLVSIDLAGISKEEKILEIGSGIGLLSYFLASKGFRVTAMEPSAQGFGNMNLFQKHIELFFDSDKTRITVCESTLENFSTDLEYKYIFSINVFEHLNDPEVGLLKTEELLEDGGLARIIAPNYTIPYEPHFNIPILFTKSFTHFVFRSRIRSFLCHDSVGLWASLNWISIPSVRKFLLEREINNSFSSEATTLYFARLTSEDQFAKRKGKVINFLARGAKFVYKFLPERFMLVIDLRLWK
jgi:hypothetical protein